MKAEFKSSLLIAVMVLLFSSCSNDWGHTDPPAGNQVYPTMEKLVTYAFDSDEELDPLVFNLKSYPEGQLPAIVEDEIAASPVLSLDGGYVRMVNPWTLKESQTAASMTFWMKQVRKPVADTEAQADGDGEVQLEPQDISSPLFHWENENATSTLDFSANGWWKYKGVDGSWEVNNPAEFATGYIAPDEWHYVALVVRDDSYGIYVDGEKKVDAPASGDISNVVKFIANAPYFFINYGADTHTSFMIEDLTIYRNSISAKEIAKPKKGNIGGGGSVGGIDYATFEYVPDNATYEVGTPDCSAGWWTSFSNYYRIPANTHMRFKFINHTSGAGNWNNWNLCVCTDDERGGAGYSEYFVIRSDLYGWGGAYNGDNWSNTGYGDWDKFRQDMEGAEVIIDLRREGAEVKVTATATAPDGTVYEERFHATCDEGDQIIRAFLIVDASYLEMDKEGCFAYWDVPVTINEIGTPDCSAGWWTTFSDYFTIPSNLSLNLDFINHTSGGGNWNNWNLCVCTDDERGGAGYSEYFVIRSDLYGWGGAYNGDNWSNTGYGDWDKFRQDMEGASVTIKTCREGEEVKVTATATAVNGTVYEERFHATCNDGDPIRAFLIVDASYLEMNAGNCYTYKLVYK